MAVISTKRNEELEAEGEDELTLAVVRYTGSRSIYNDEALGRQGNFPSGAALNGGPNGEPGPWKFPLIPSRNLGWFETHNDLEIAYGAEAVASALLERNFLPPNVFGANFDPDLRDRVFELVGIEQPKMSAEGYREVLSEVAGVDDPGEEVTQSTGPEYDLTRSELQKVTGAFPNDLHLGRAQTTDMEDFLRSQDQTAVRARIEQVQAGEKPDPYTGNGDVDEATEADGDVDEAADEEVTGDGE